MLGHFLEFMDLSSDRKRLDSYFGKRTSSTAAVNANSCGVFSPPGAEAPKSVVGTPAAEKRRKISNCATAGPPHLSCSRGRYTGGSGEALDTATLARGDRQRATRGEGEAPRPRVKKNPNAGGSGSVSAAASAAPAPAIDVSGDAVAELDLGDVDVEAQKAIMADIERRKGEDRRGRGCERQDQTPGSARREAETSAGFRPKPASAGKGRKAPGSSAKRAAASRPGGSGGRSAGWAVGVKSQSKTAAVAASKPEGGFDGQQLFSMDDDEPSAGSCSPMDIRDFFARRG